MHVTSILLSKSRNKAYFLCKQNYSKYTPALALLHVRRAAFNRNFTVTEEESCIDISNKNRSRTWHAGRRRRNQLRLHWTGRPCKNLQGRQPLLAPRAPAQRASSAVQPVLARRALGRCPAGACLSSVSAVSGRGRTPDADASIPFPASTPHFPRLHPVRSQTLQILVSLFVLPHLRGLHVTQMLPCLHIQPLLITEMHG